MMQQINDVLIWIDSHLGGSQAFVYLLLGTGIFFTLYLKFPQIRYFRHAISIVAGKYDKTGDKGDTSHFQALTTALSGTVGTGNIAGVALAIHLGGPAALFWMLVTASLGMTTKFVEVLLSHKYRETDSTGHIAGGSMYYMKKRLNIKLANGKMIKSGYLLGGIFAVSTIFCSFGTGNLPQINSISNVVYSTFGVPLWVTGLLLAILLGLVIIGGIKRIAKVTSSLVPAMAGIYFLGVFSVLIANYQHILPSIAAIFSNVFTGTATTGGFLGAGFAYAFNRGVNRGLFSNEAGQGSAPIAHAAARAHEPVSEGMVAILEPFIDTIIICFLTGITILSSGVWNKEFENRFQSADTTVLQGKLDQTSKSDNHNVYLFLRNSDKSTIRAFSGTLDVKKGSIQNGVTVINSRSIARNVMVTGADQKPYTGSLQCNDGNIEGQDNTVFLSGKSLVHSAPLTALAFNTGIFGNFGQYIVAIGILLFAFSTAISWSYYGDRAVTYLWSPKYVLLYRVIYVIGFFLASFTDTTIVWTFSGITIALMTIPNLFGLLILSKEIKTTIKDYWTDFQENFGDIIALKEKRK